MRNFIGTGTALFILTISLVLGVRAEAADVEMEREIVQEINRLRENPAAYADELSSLRPLYQDNQRKITDTLFLQTHEGVAAVDDAMAALRRTPARKPLRWDPALEASAAELVQAENRSGAYGHGSGGDSFRQRIHRHKPHFHTVGENISYGSATAQEVVQSLVIDDGVPDRGHRKNMLSLDFDAAGAACGEHANLSPACVIDFSGG